MATKEVSSFKPEASNFSSVFFKTNDANLAHIVSSGANSNEIIGIQNFRFQQLSLSFRRESRGVVACSRRFKSSRIARAGFRMRSRKSTPSNESQICAFFYFAMVRSLHFYHLCCNFCIVWFVLP
ncbi:cytochrome P450 monooxygenase [Striga asiatica]|uniref:Cytochrome P450 monooxygenase n=1 Tax=Striga asiatica TaxID=4170 RepID=A0A5A7R9P2_STRAF|nr:cytochrome P450 monooxygenase [Striga asiatica]